MESQSKLQIQADIKTGKIDLASSYILDYELSRNPFEMRKLPIMRFLSENVKFYVGAERADSISSMAEEIMQTGIKEKDAYHVAAAIYAKCDYFISTDIRLLKYKSDRIKLVTPIEFITETEGEA
jgi:predicted nucleic acid-binding protein